MLALRSALLSLVLPSLACGGDPFGPPPDCPLTSEAVLDVLPVRFAKGTQTQLVARWDREVVPADLPDNFSLALTDEDGRTVGTWPVIDPQGSTGAIADVDILGQRSFFVDVDVDPAATSDAYELHVTYSPDPEACPGPVHSVALTVE
jgi:hypothetical protein